MADDDAPPQIDTSQPNPPPDTPTVMPQGPATPPLGQENLGVPSSIQQKATQKATPGLPIVWQLISDMKNAGQPGHPGSRLEGFESFLGNFINALGQGFANEGHGPGAWARGAGAALTAPMRTEMAAQQFGAQQAQAAAQTGLTGAETQRAQAGTALTQAQTGLMQSTVPLSIPGVGTVSVPANKVGDVLAQYGRGMGAAGISAQAKITTEQMKAQILSGQVSRILPITDESGHTVMRAFNKQMQPLGDIEGALPPASYLPKSSSTVEIKDDGQGGFVAIPKSTTTAPIIPRTGGQVSGGGGGIGHKGAAAPVLGGDGQPITSPSSKPSQQSRSRGDAATATMSLIQDARNLIADPEVANSMGPLSGRWSDIENKIGNLPPKTRQLAGTLMSIYSLAGTMHGWRALQVAQEFSKTYGDLKADPKSILGGLAAMENTARAVEGVARTPQQNSKIPNTKKSDPLGIR